LKLENKKNNNKKQKNTMKKKKTKFLCPKDNKTYTFNETKTQRMLLNLKMKKNQK
jgi:hypothetical protein